MTRIVCDTNILVSSVIKETGEVVQLILLFRQQKIELITSEKLLNELNNVLYYSHIKNRYNLSEEKIKKFVNFLRRRATIIQGDYEVDTLDKIEPKDNKVLACALEGKADYIISGDKKHILPLKQFQGIQIVTVRQFLNTIE
ncbi:putative toxin-antitoxin system toxin component, PIN family [candidate division CSSED10-310 bacterium]|uniref:Toxin-antitoxin system toxin component, PIN family n=1 Tax=candidate division CSSED10-310 bacterium TaxID=2855610 RepID=A0ABV6YTT1_UNCC1